jgi:hypothetical protein
MHDDQQPYTHHEHYDGNPELDVSQNASPYSRLVPMLTIHKNPRWVLK